MTVILRFFAIALLVLPSTTGLFHRCPPSNGSFGDFYNSCVCTKSPQATVRIVCQEITTDQVLLDSLSKLRKYVVDEFTLKRSGPLTLDSSHFRKLNIHKLVFEDVNFVTASVFGAFSGLQFMLEELHFVRCTVGFWSWGLGRNLAHLKTVRFEDTRLPSILTSNLFFTHFPSDIRRLLINGCSVRTIGNQSFQRFTNLEQLELNRNKITTIQRSIFPYAPRRLKYISLSGNPLLTIAENTFANMMRLEFLSVSDTRLTSLRRDVFFPVWDQLEEIYFNNIHLNCTCESKWMLDVPDFKVFRAPYCDSHGKTLTELTELERSRLC